MMNIKVFQSTDQLYQETATFFLELIQRYIREKGHCNLGLAGGNTYREVYKMLAEYEEEVAWNKVHFFWGDERCVPITHKDSNAAMVYDTLLNEIPVPSENIHIIHGEKEPELALGNYMRILSDYFGTDKGLDILLLGLGADGHTASLFPDNPVLEVNDKPVSYVNVPELNTHRITLTAPFLNRSENIIFVSTGKAKAKAVSEVIEGERNIQKYPAQLIQPDNGSLYWFLDVAAAAGLKQHS